MHAGLLTPTVPDTDDAGSDFMITMLDGDLGAVTDPGASALRNAETVCWCGCIVCLAPPSMRADADQG